MPSENAGPYGWTGRILRVDLSSGKTSIQPTLDYADFIGGRGIGQKILFDEVGPETDAFDPANKVIFGAGPLVGTLAPASARMSVETKNTLTHGLCSSNFGGHLAPELKYAGFDAVVIEGAAAQPSILVISDGQARIERMPELWGLTTWQAEEIVQAKLGGSGWRMASIGPAGENRVRGGCIIGDRGRAAGRGGSGAVLGSKRLKIIAIRGTQPARVADPQGFLSAVRSYLRKFDASPRIAKLREGGTHLTSGAGGYDGKRSQAVRNYQDEFWLFEKTAKIREPVFRKRFEVRRLACFNCPMYCSHFHRVKDGPYAGVACEGLQTNTVRAFGSNLEIDEPSAILAAQALCSQLGIDVDMATATIAWAFESYERGVLSPSDTGGLELRWGNHTVLPTLLNQIARREGFGALLADGVYHAAMTLGRGSERWAMHVKGADLNEQGMRWNKAWALGIVTSSRGGGHLDGASPAGFWHLTPQEGLEMFGVATAGDPLIYAENAPVVVWFEWYKAVVDSLGLCSSTGYVQAPDLLGPDDYACLFSLATGRETSGQQLLSIGRRIQNLAKAFNTLHAGFGRADDYPPRRLVEEPTKSGPYQGEALDPVRWGQMLDAYYAAQGWSVSNGLQTKELLADLDLLQVAEKLQRFGKLA